jgi:hypothetical protein
MKTAFRLRTATGFLHPVFGEEFSPSGFLALVKDGDLLDTANGQVPHRNGLLVPLPEDRADFLPIPVAFRDIGKLLHARVLEIGRT